MDWLELALKYGLPSGLLIGLGIFFTKYAWPFITKAWEEQQQERRSERSIFLSTLEAERRAIRDERVAFQEMLMAERVMRIEERDKFLGALDRHGEQIARQGDQLVNVTKTLFDIQQVLENNNGS